MPALKAKVKTKITGDALFKEFTKVFKAVNGSYVDIGILEPNRRYPPDPDNKSNKPPPTLGQVAAWQEFGTHNKAGEVMTPSRSFIRAPIALGIRGIERLKKRVMNAVANGNMSIEEAFKAVGFDLVRRMQKAILQRIPPELAPYTLSKRKSSQGTIPLYKTRWLWRSIHFKVHLTKNAKAK